MKKLFFFLTVIAGFLISCEKPEDTNLDPVEAYGFSVDSTYVSDTELSFSIEAKVRNMKDTYKVYVYITGDSYYYPMELTMGSPEHYTGLISIYDTDILDGETISFQLYIDDTDDRLSNPVAQNSFQESFVMDWGSIPTQGIFNANLSQVFAVTPNGATTTVTYINTTGADVELSVVVTGGPEGTITYPLVLPTASFADEDYELEGLTPGEGYVVYLKSNGETLDTVTFELPVVSYTNVTTVAGNSNATTYTLTPGMSGINFSDAKFTANGVTDLVSVEYRFKSFSTDVDVWNILLILGQTGNNLAVANSSNWTSLGDGWYGVTLTIDTPVAALANTDQNFVSTQNYLVSTSVTFEYEAVYTDAQGVVFGEGEVMTLTINP